MHQTKCIFNFHYRLIIVVVDCNKVATVVVLTCPFIQVILKMNRPTYNFTGVIFYWGICTFTQYLICGPQPDYYSDYFCITVQ